MAKHKPELVKAVINSFLDYLLAQIKDEKLVIAIDSDGTVVTHTWGRSVKYFNPENCNYDVLSALIEATKERGLQDQIKLAIVSKQYQDIDVAQEAALKKKNRSPQHCLDNLYKDYAADLILIGREHTGSNPSQTKGRAVAARFSTFTNSVLTIDDDSNENLSYANAGLDVIDSLSSTKDCSAVMSAWEEDVSEDSVKAGNPFGFCVESILLFLLKKDFQISAEILAAAGLKSGDKAEQIKELEAKMNLRVMQQEEEFTPEQFAAVANDLGDKRTSGKSRASSDGEPQAKRSPAKPSAEQLDRKQAKQKLTF